MHPSRRHAYIATHLPSLPPRAQIRKEITLISQASRPHPLSFRLGNGKLRHHLGLLCDGGLGEGTVDAASDIEELKAVYHFVKR